ncbi:MAG: hypothetical protein PVF58_19555, partial [Candidatus Methanofastidiosia archaeon]
MSSESIPVEIESINIEEFSHFIKKRFNEGFGIKPQAKLEELSQTGIFNILCKKFRNILYKDELFYLAVVSYLHDLGHSLDRKEFEKFINLSWIEWEEYPLKHETKETIVNFLRASFSREIHSCDINISEVELSKHKNAAKLVFYTTELENCLRFLACGKSRMPYMVVQETLTNSLRDELRNKLLHLLLTKKGSISKISELETKLEEKKEILDLVCFSEPGREGELFFPSILRKYFFSVIDKNTKYFEICNNYFSDMVDREFILEYIDIYGSQKPLFLVLMLYAPDWRVRESSIEFLKEVKEIDIIMHLLWKLDVNNEPSKRVREKAANVLIELSNSAISSPFLYCIKQEPLKFLRCFKENEINFNYDDSAIEKAAMEKCGFSDRIIIDFFKGILKTCDASEAIIDNEKSHLESEDWRETANFILSISKKPEIIKDIGRGYIINLIDRVYAKYGDISSDNLVD